MTKRPKAPRCMRTGKHSVVRWEPLHAHNDWESLLMRRGFRWRGYCRLCERLARTKEEMREYKRAWYQTRGKLLESCRLKRKRFPPVKLKFKLKRKRTNEVQCGWTTPIAIMARGPGDNRWRIISRYETENEAVIELARMMGPDIYRFVQGD